MAKKITNPESETPEIPGTQSENTEQPTPAPEPSKEESEPQPEIPATPEPAPKVEKKEPQNAPVQAIPEHADRILKTFPSYPELYIDTQGGTYTVDSPPMFHSNATLYKNPYHKN